MSRFRTQTVARFVLGFGTLYLALSVPPASAQGGEAPPYLDTKLTAEQGPLTWFIA